MSSITITETVFFKNNQPGPETHPAFYSRSNGGLFHRKQRGRETGLKNQLQAVSKIKNKWS